MALASPFVIALEADEQARLEEVAASRTTPAGPVQRAVEVLACAEGMSNAATTRRIGRHVDTVRAWRKRFATERMAAVSERPRPRGRPQTVLRTRLCCQSMRRLGSPPAPASIPTSPHAPCDTKATVGAPFQRWPCPGPCRRCRGLRGLRLCGSATGVGAARRGQGHRLCPCRHAANRPILTASSDARRRRAGSLDSASSRTMRFAYPLYLIVSGAASCAFSSVASATSGCPSSW